MNKNYLFGVMAALMMTACSSDEVVEVNQSEISYHVLAGTQTKAADDYCNNVLPNLFKVWASYSDGTSTTRKDFILGDRVVRNGDTWVNETATRYWPNSGTLDFYAHVNARGGNFNWNNGAPKIEDFTVGTNAAEQLDLLYAVKMNQPKPANGKVTLNFRHALSQVVFQAKNTNKDLHVVIKGVTVGHLNNVGTYNYKAETTDDNYVNHEETAGTAYPTAGRGTWDLKPSLQNYTVSFTPVHLDVKDQVYSLTNPYTEQVQLNNVLMLLPQTQSAWNPTVTSTEWNGAYFLVDCQLWNVVGTEFDASKDVLLNDGKIAIPVSINWQEGKKYIYTFIFGDGNGGYNPDPSDPTPVLTHITFDVTIDDFFPVGEDKEMETNPDTPSPEPEPENGVTTGDYTQTTW